jgi:hypothetical protein
VFHGTDEAARFQRCRGLSAAIPAVYDEEHDPDQDLLRQRRQIPWAGSQQTIIRQGELGQL